MPPESLPDSSAGATHIHSTAYSHQSLHSPWTPTHYIHRIESDNTFLTPPSQLSVHYLRPVPLPVIFNGCTIHAPLMHAHSLHTQRLWCGQDSYRRRRFFTSDTFRLWRRRASRLSVLCFCKAATRSLQSQLNPVLDTIPESQHTLSCVPYL